MSRPLSTLLSIALAISGTAIVFRQVLFVDSSGVLWADDVDANLLRWAIEWGHHSLTTNPREFWNANIFYPHNLTTAYSDSMLGIQFVYTPLRLVGLDALNAIYWSLAFYSVLGCSLTFWALGRIGCLTISERALISYSAHFSLSMVSFFGHYQLVGFQLAPACLIFFHLTLRDWRPGDLFACAAVFSLAVLFSLYLGPILVALTALLAIPQLAPYFRGLLRRRQSWSRRVAIALDGTRTVAGKIGTRGTSILLLFSGFLFAVQLWPYLKMLDSATQPSDDHIAAVSATWSSLLSEISVFSMWYGPSAYDRWFDWERAYFPGYLLLGVVILFFVLFATSLWRRREFLRDLAKETAIDRQFLQFSLVLFLATWMLSLGPHWVEHPLLKFPFYFYSKILPGLKNIRCPGRFGMLFGLPISIFAIAMIRLLTEKQLMRSAITVGVLLGVAIESVPRFPLYAFTIPRREIYERVHEVMPEGTPLIELPVVREEEYLGTLKNILQQMNGSTIHWGKLVVGYGARSTDERDTLISIDRRLHGGGASIEQVIEFANSLSVENLLVHVSDYPPLIAKKWHAYLDRLGPSETVVFQEDGSALVRIRRDEPGDSV